MRSSGSSGSSPTGSSASTPITCERPGHAQYRDYGVRRVGAARPGDAALPLRRAVGYTALSVLRSARCVLAGSLARRIQVDARPITNRASANHGARMVGLVTL